MEYRIAIVSINGLATDILEEESGRKSHPYLVFDNVVVTPHNSTYTLECLEQMSNKCVTDVEEIVQCVLPERAIQSKSKFIKERIEKYIKRFEG